MYELHGNHKSKTYNRYKEHKHTTKENHQTTREEVIGLNTKTHLYGAYKRLIPELKTHTD